MLQDNILVKDGHAYVSDFGVSRDALRGHTSNMTGSTRNCARERLFPQESGSTTENANNPTKMSDVAEFGFVCLEVRSGTEKKSKQCS
jgi:serine/threonine protein kinase